jgi:hypothetical protein
MVCFSVTIQRPNCTTMTKEFGCPLERRKWVREVMPKEIPGAVVIEYSDDIELNDDGDVPPAGEEQWYQIGKGGLA